MTKSILRTALRTSSAIAVATVAFSTPAFAQAADAVVTDDVIVVTGSRISRPDLENASPVSVTSKEELDIAGTVNVEEILTDLPQVVPTLTSASNNPGDGAATVDLRGLGASRTLVLVNGRRYVSYDDAQIVDLNTIPAGLIERVDVVTGGRSAVYGSDAVAGVVNFVLRDDFQGAEFNSQYRLTEDGDGKTFSVDGLIGGNFEDGRGNATLYASYLKRDPIFQGDREYSRQALIDDGEGGVFFGGSASILESRLVPSGLGGRQFDAGGNLVADDGDPNAAGTNVRFLDNGDFVAYNATTDQYNYAPVNYLQTPQERYLINATAHYEISPAFEPFMELTYINSQVNTQLAPTPVSSGQFPATANSPAGTIAIATDNPFLSAETQARFAALDASELQIVRDADDNPVVGPDGETLYEAAPTAGDGFITGSLGRRFAEGGARFQQDQRDAFRILAGTRGDIGSGFSYDAYYSYARNKDLQAQAGNVQISRFVQALDAVQTPTGIECRDTSNGCVPVNIFGAGNTSAAAADFVTVPTTNRYSISEQVASVTLSNGDLGDIGGGPIGVAVGAEYRKLSGSYTPDPVLSAGDVVGFNAGQPTSGSYDVKELFAEVAVPVLAGLPFVDSLELNGAVRYSDYNNAVGGVWAYAGGAQYTPVVGMTFRGQYQRAVRAPTIRQLFQGGSVGFPSATDPCEQPIAATNENLRQSCLAQGVPGSLIGDDFAGGNSQIQSQFGGNENLTEEKSDTYTAGVIIAPVALNGLSLTADYYNITIDNFISTDGPGTANILAACYGDANSDFVPYDASVCSLAPRNPASFGLENVASINANLGALKTEGVDVELRYGLGLPFLPVNGDEAFLSIRATGTYLINYDLTPIASAPGLVNDCEGTFGNICGGPYAKFRSSVRTTLTTGPVTTSVLWRHIGSSTDDDDGALYFRERFSAENYFDLAFAFSPAEEYTFRLGVDNVFDNQPQIGGSNMEQANTFPSTYDPFGRRYYASVSLGF